MLRKKLVQWLGESVSMLLVAASSLALLLYVGFGDGKRTFEQIQIEKLTAQGLYVQNSLEKFVRDGLPLKQYAGFATLAAAVVEGEDVDAVVVYDFKGNQLFKSLDKDNPTLPPTPEEVKSPGGAAKVLSNGSHYQIVLPVRDKFETVGSVLIVAPSKLIAQRISDAFLPLVKIIFILSVIFSLIVVFGKPYLKSLRVPWLQMFYGGTFIIMAGFVVAALVHLYLDGLQSKARATAFTLSQRLTDVVEFKLNFKDIEGIDQVFRDFQKQNPSITETAVVIDGAIEVAADNRTVGKRWLPDSSAYEYKLDLSRNAQSVAAQLAVTVPVRVIWERVGRSVKNFAALFIASAFLSALFLQVAASFQQRNQGR